MQRSSLRIMTFAYFWLACLLYSQSINKIFDYEGFSAQFDLISFLASLLLLLPTSLLVKQAFKPTDTLFFFMVYLIIVPTLTLYSFQAVKAEAVGITFLGLGTVVLFWKLSPIKVIRLGRLSASSIRFLMILISMIFIALLINFTGPGSFNIDLSMVYFQRDILNDALPTYMFYTLTLVTKIFLPLLVVWSLQRKQKIAALFFLVLAIVIFGFTGHKAVPLYSFVAMAIYYLMEKSLNPMKVMSAGLLGILVLSMVDLILFSKGLFEPYTGWFGSIFGRRLLFLPSFLNAAYIDFFVSEKAYYWSASSITFGLIEQPYELVPAELVGARAFGLDDNYANAGWIGAGFSQAKLVGVILYSAILGVVFKILDVYGRLLSPSLIASTSAIPVIVILTSSDLLTGLLTHGLGLLILIFVVMSNKKLRVCH